MNLQSLLCTIYALRYLVNEVWVNEQNHPRDFFPQHSINELYTGANLIFQPKYGFCIEEESASMIKNIVKHD